MYDRKLSPFEDKLDKHTYYTLSLKESTWDDRRKKQSRQSRTKMIVQS